MKSLKIGGQWWNTTAQSNPSCIWSEWISRRFLTWQDQRIMRNYVPMKIPQAQVCVEITQNAVYPIDIVRAQRMGLKFYRIRTNAIILLDNLLPRVLKELYSVKTVVKSFLYTRISKSSRPSPTISLKANWRTKFGSECWSISQKQSISAYGETRKCKEQDNTWST